MSLKPLGWSGLFLCAITLAPIASGQQINGNPQGPFAPAPNPIPIGMAPHDILDSDPDSWTSVGVNACRPMALTPDNLRLYVVNVHDSKVRSFDFTGASGIQDWRVPWAPVSVAIYDVPSLSLNWLLVVSGGNHVLTILDRFTGELLEVVPLPFEPADILVDVGRQEAYISCSGADSLAVVDLTTFAVVEHPVPSKHPTYLSFDDEGRVLIAPMISGNNSTTESTGANASFVIVDLDDPANSPSGGLPDEDCFRFDPTTGTMTAVARRVGTILFGQGVNPANGKFWQLNFEASNKDPARQNEPAIRGTFGLNRLTITDLPDPGQPIADRAIHTFIDLDDSDPVMAGQQIDPLRTVGLPIGLEFTGAGYGIIVGLLTDNVTVLTPQGDFFTEFDLWQDPMEADPARHVPRAVLSNSLGTILMVYCSNTNLVQFYDASVAPTINHVFDLDIGFDPTPELVKLGRALFYDGSRSLHNNLSCASCHIDGRTDLLAWELSNTPFDEKGPLVTQTLKGIEKQGPFHWRGERANLDAFNVAFDGLLGGTPLDDEFPEDELGQFKAFVFSLNNTANPGQDETNFLTPGLSQPSSQGLVGSPIDGREHFLTIPSLGAQSCGDCHQLPSGTDSDMVRDINDYNPALLRAKPTAFNELWRKDQPIVTVDGAQKPLLGTGLLHDGRQLSLEAFINGPFALTPQQAKDTFDYVTQFPSETAPMVHKADLFDEHHPVIADRVEDYYLDQAHRGYGSVALVGSMVVDGADVPVNWQYDSSTGLFVPDSPAFSQMTFAELKSKTLAGLASNMVLGLPLGNAERFAIDSDLDELINQEEIALGTNPFNPDSDGDGDPDGHEVANGGDPLDATIGSTDGTPPEIQNMVIHWVSTKNARLTFETSEPCRTTVTYFPVGTTGLEQTVSNGTLRKRHSFILSELVPSTKQQAMPPVSADDEVLNTYTVKIEAVDAAGLPDMAFAEELTTGGFTFRAGTLFGVIGQLDLISPMPDYVAGTLDFTMRLRMESKIGRSAATGQSLPLGGMVAACQVIVNGNVHSDFDVIPNRAKKFCLTDLNNPTTTIEFDARPGPFVLTDQTDSSGLVDTAIQVRGLNPGDEVVINPIAVQQTVFVGSNYDPLDDCPDLSSAEALIFAMDFAFPDSVIRRASITH